jgi:hypothetical protein
MPAIRAHAAEPAKLSQIVAIQKAASTAVNREVTDRYHQLQKPGLLSGISRTYVPKDDEGEQFPPESTKVQVKATEVLAESAKALTRLFDVTATKDWGNCIAKADVVVDGQTLLRDVPATYLLFLEKQLTDLHTVIKTIPLLDAAEDWHRDEASGTWRTPPVHTMRTRKVYRNHVKSEATDKHPAQVEVYTEDATVGTWATVKSSGAIDPVTRAAILSRIEKLAHAVKYAREEANTTPVADQKIGETLFGYLLAQ